MGGGLVFFGIGGDVSGGLFDAFSDRSSSGSGLIEQRIEDSEEKVEENPRDKAALQDLIRDWYQLANEQADSTTGAYTDEGKERLAEADQAWQAYLEVEEKPEPSLASLMVQVYGQAALNKPAEGAEAAEIVAVATPKADAAQAYLQLAQFAALAGLMGQPGLASSARFATVDARRRHEGELEACLSAWTAGEDAEVLAERLRAVGVPAARVRRVDEVMACEHLAQRGFFTALDHVEVGPRPLAGPPWHPSRSPMSAARAAPLLGEHTHEVMTGIVGLSPDEYARLAETGLFS